MGEYEGYVMICVGYSVIQLAGHSVIQRDMGDTAGYSGMSRDTVGCSGIQLDTAGYSGIL